MKVLIGFSGGVDSAVAAYLLKKEGHEVTGAFMRNWDSLANGDFLGNPNADASVCPQEQDYEDAKKAAEKLGIPLLRVDFVKEYWDKVFSYFLSEYEKGRTPNPDVYCNKYIKFDSFLDFAKEKGFGKIAMGHYAKKIEDGGHSYIGKARDLSKDQSYFLCQLSEEQVESCLFPLGEWLKTDVRKLAKELGLDSVAEKKDSTGVCFIGERNFREFLHNYFPAKKGPIVEEKTGKEIGTHMGVLYYTIGQRKGLGIGGIKGEGSNSWFVSRKDVKNNILYVNRGSDEELYCDEIEIDTLNILGGPYEEGKEVGVKFRYRAPDVPCRLYIKGNTAILKTVERAKAVAPGQFAVIYDGDRLIGSGIIKATFRNGLRTDAV